MLEIKPIEDKSEQEEICRLCGVSYSPELFAYKAYDNGTLLAVSQFDIEGETAVIYDLKQVIGTKDDFEGMFIMGRAVLNFLDLCSVKNAIFKAETEQKMKLAKLIGFKNENGVMKLSLEGLFTNPCKHGNSYESTKDSI